MEPCDRLHESVGRLQTGPTMGVVHSGERNPNWKGGRTIASNGYVLVKRPDHERCDSRGYVYEHRLVAEEMLDRPLGPGEQVHHINGNKTDNRPENLEVVASHAEHGVRHRTTGTDRRLPGEMNLLTQCACGCGVSFKFYDKYGRPRRYVSGHNLPEVKA